MRVRLIVLAAFASFAAMRANATIFSSITGLIHDPQHRPVPRATVTVSADNSKWTQTSTSDDSGEFRFDNVPLGSYMIQVEAEGFRSQIQKLTLKSDNQARLHFPLVIASTNATVEVRDSVSGVNPDSSASTSIISREQITETPGASHTNSMAMITNYVPGAMALDSSTAMAPLTYARIRLSMWHLAKSFADKFSLRLTGLNLSNNHYLLDNSNTFGGTHFVNPREISAQVTYKFRY